MDILNGCMPHQNIIQLQIISKNSDYKIYKFKDILVDETRKVKKIKKADYLSKGKNPIVDQSKDFISGYTDCNDKIYKQYPYILFGDHTRVFKYINFESYLGADGAKIINVHEKYSEKIDIKYIYYFLKSVGIPDTGYNRHFKYVKSLLFPVPPMELQEKIVKVLDQAQALIDKRKEQIEALDQLIESIFYTMFGDPVRNEKGWEIEQLGDLVMINPKKSEVSDMKKSDMYVSFVPMKDVGEDGVLDLQERRKLNDVYAGYTYFKENDVLFAKITPCMENGKSCIAKGLINEIGFGSTEFHVIRESTVLTKEYIFNLVRSKKFKEEAENKMTGSAGQKRVPREFLESYSISVPPLYLQNEFAQKVEAIEKQKEVSGESLELMEGNYKSIMNKAFKGQLFN